MADEAIAVLNRPAGDEWEESETPERIAERLKAQHGISQEQWGAIPDRGAASWRPAGQNSLAVGRLGGGPRGPMTGKHKHFAIVN